MVTYCSKDEEEFDLSVLNSISDRLSQVWPALKGGDHENFHNYQYKKHGSCATETPSLFGIRNFFETTLSMYERLDLDNALKKINFGPTNQARPYRTMNFFNQLVNFYGVTPYIRCFNLANNIALIENISFCYDKQLNLINCPQKLQCKREFLFPSSEFQLERLQ